MSFVLECLFLDHSIGFSTYRALDKSRVKKFENLISVKLEILN